MARPMPSRMRTDREFRRKMQTTREMNQARGMIERWFAEREFMDNRRPPEVSPPAVPRPPRYSKKRKPIFEGHLVTGKRENYGTA